MSRSLSLLLALQSPFTRPGSFQRGAGSNDHLSHLWGGGRGVGTQPPLRAGGRSSGCAARGPAGLGTTPETGRRGLVCVLDAAPLPIAVSRPPAGFSPDRTDGA